MAKETKVKQMTYSEQSISSLISLPVNYFISYPVFAKVFAPMDLIMGMYQAILPTVDSLWEALIIFNLPFTFVKGIVCVIITFFIYKPLSPILKGVSKKANK